MEISMKIDIDNLHICSSRIEIRRIYESDLESLFEVYSDPEVMRFASDPTFNSFEMMNEFLTSVNKGYNSHEYYELAIVLSGGSAIGTCSIFSFSGGNKSAEIGYLLGRKYWRQGIMFETLNILLQYCFDALELKRIFAEVDIENISSQKLLLKLGFQPINNNESMFFKEAY
jgi:RimJ/RimL family protein N-acetyltransferase